MSALSRTASDVIFDLENDVLAVFELISALNMALQSPIEDRKAVARIAMVARDHAARVVEQWEQAFTLSRNAGAPPSAVG